MSIHINTSSSVYVSWLPPDIEFWNGVITNYTVVYVDLGVVQGNMNDTDQMPFINEKHLAVHNPRACYKLIYMTLYNYIKTG